CADIFVLPSHVEGMSNALLEAMSSGLAVIASRVGASESMIIPDRNGLLVGAGNQSELKQALVRLITNADERMQMGLEARRTTVATNGVLVSGVQSVILPRILNEEGAFLSKSIRFLGGVTGVALALTLLMAAGAGDLARFIGERLHLFPGLFADLLRISGAYF